MPTALRELAPLFLRLGLTAFGGPVAHTATMEAEVVRRRGWLTPTAFLDLVSATQLVPGPNSTELAMHIGYARARWAGLVVAGTAFIVPAACVTLGVAWAYTRYGILPRGQAILAGVAPVVLAVVAHALWGLGKTAVHSALTLAIAVAAAAAVALGVHELLVLAVAGSIAALDRRVTAGGDPLAPAVDPVALTTLFGVFAKAGGLLFGSGYVLIAYLRADLVARLGWFTEAQLVDAIAVGQATPGPVFTTATFVGYQLAGLAGAAIATLGIFLPAFGFVALTAPVLPRLRAHRDLAAAIDGLNAASVGLMLAVLAPIAAGATTRPLLLAGVGLPSLALLVTGRAGPMALLAGGAGIGLLLG
ncbi:MAG: chromate transporter [Gemmatimonadota bacterium]|jgi:chromate transporter|nr:chromate transporter [Gemmatimonadota bacterium]